jgi:hypothetical protein
MVEGSLLAASYLNKLKEACLDNEKECFFL